MPFDTSFLGNVQPVQMPSLMDSQAKAMSLSQMGMQNQGMALQQAMQQRQLGMQLAARQAYADNVDQNGVLNKTAYLNTLARLDPNLRMSQEAELAKVDKSSADAQSAKMEALNKIVGQTLPAMDYLHGLSESQRAQEFPAVMKQLEAQGIPMTSVQKDAAGNPIYDPQLFARAYHVLQNTAAYLANQSTRAKTGEANAKTAETYAQIGKIKTETGEVMNKYVTALKDDLDPNKARGGNLAKSQAVVNATDRLNAMFKQFPDYNIPKAQQTELVSAFGAILNGGSAPLQSQIEELVPQSARGSASEMAAWVTNDPLGQNQQKFMQLLHESVNRERDVAENQVRTAQVQRLAGNQFLRERDPETYWSVLHGYGIEPENIKDGKYVPSGQGAPMPPPSGEQTIRMMGPDGQIRQIPMSMKGAAIIHGGKVVQ